MVKLLGIMHNKMGFNTGLGARRLHIGVRISWCAGHVMAQSRGTPGALRLHMSVPTDCVGAAGYRFCLGRHLCS